MLLRHINYFLAVAEHCSFTRAAAALHVSQPALSQQIRQLEERLDAQLFDRTGRAICLTDAGKVYFHHARQALLDLERGERAIHDVGDLSRGTLRIAVTPTFTTYLVGPLVELFHNLYPNIILTIREVSQEYMEELLLADIIDVGIAFADTSSPDIAIQELLVETLALVVGRHHRLAKCEMISLKDLQDEALVLLTSEFATRKQIDHACHENNIHPRVAIEANSLSAVIEIVRRTNLSTLLPIKTAGSQEGLVAVAMDPVLLDRTAVLLQRKNAYQAVAVRAFIELALKVAGTVPKTV